MAFHTACPITCLRICDCELGFAGSGRVEFFDRVSRVEEFLRDPWLVKDAIGDTVQVAVPRVPPTPVEDGSGEEAAAEVAKRAALQRKAAVASRAVEEYARRVEAGIALDVSGEAAIDLAQEDQGSSVKIICRICFSGENEGSKRAIKMQSCKFCNKKYHRSCLKIWAEYRDLFHWSSWACPSCRICEVCRRAGDPNKLMYCKRCDDAYHCYCQQPPHKNVTHGPFLCPKHTRCHSCGSNVSGSGHSTRWFLAYTCCDACGRLFVKGKYCPVCLKVYRDSEMTPMVCCDICQQWIHCECDSISDEKYQQFQSDGNLSYTCPACRGDCYQVKDTEDAIRELWRRKDKADCNLIASLRSAAGLLSDGEIFSISPYSDDGNENGPGIKKNNSQRSLKIPVKSLADKTSKSSRQYAKNSPQSLSLNKKHSKKEYQVQSVGLTEEIHQTIEKQHEARLSGSNFEDKLFIDQKETRNSVNEAAVNNVSKVSKVHIRGSKPEGLHLKEGAKNIKKDETSRGTKLVIHLAAKNRSSPISEVSSRHRDRDFVAINGAKLDNATWNPGSNNEERENDFLKFKNVSDMHGKSIANVSTESDITPHANQPIIGKKSSSKEKVLPSQQSGGLSINIQSQIQDALERFPTNSVSDLKPLLKLKFKSPYFEQQSSWALKGVEEKNAVKGQRSKRKRVSMEKLASNQEDESSGQVYEEKPIDEVMDANWILKKLGKDAVGKRVEVHQSSDNSWLKGVVSDVIDENSSLLVRLDDGRSKTVELGKQGIRFVAHKQKRTKVLTGKS